jgi:hypothetical protein
MTPVRRNGALMRGEKRGVLKTVFLSKQIKVALINGTIRTWEYASSFSDSVESIGNDAPSTISDRTPRIRKHR